jgi:hypothetical protein
LGRSKGTALASAVDGRERSALRSGNFSPGKISLRYPFDKRLCESQNRFETNALALGGNQTPSVLSVKLSQYQDVEGVHGCEMSRISHCLDNRLTDGGNVVSLMRRQRSTPEKHYFSASGTHLCYRPSKPESLVRPEGIGTLKIFDYLIGTRSRVGNI